MKHMEASHGTILQVTCMIGVMVVGMSSACLAAGPQAGTWSGGGAIGFLGNTPDGTAFATNFNADYFVTQQLSLGPLAQIAATGDLFQLAFQARRSSGSSCPISTSG